MKINVEIPPRYNLMIFTNNFFACDINGNLHLKEIANPEIKSVFFSSDYVSAKNKKWDSLYIYIGQQIKNNECFLALEFEQGKELEQQAAFFIIYKDENLRYNIRRFDESNNVLTSEQSRELFAKMIDIYKQQM